jgi:hypothetical protein
MIGQAADLALHANTPLTSGLATPLSAANDYFSSKPFANYIKQIEAQSKATGMVMQGIGAVVSSIVMLGRALGRR